MSIFKACFSAKGKKAEKFSARSSVIKSPPSGRVTESEDPNKDIWKEQFSSGDQTDACRIPFFNSGFAACVQCGERNVGRFEEKAGVKMNGETYGTDVFICQTKGCKWETSFKYDDGYDDCPHYEALGWPRGVLHFPVTFMMMWADKHSLNAAVKHQIFEQKITGDKMLQMAEDDTIMKTLKTDRKTNDKILKALHDKYGALLQYHK